MPRCFWRPGGLFCKGSASGERVRPVGRPSGAFREHLPYLYPKASDMEYQRFGHSGLQISRIIVGCMGFGDPSRGAQAWAQRTRGKHTLVSS